MLSTDKCTKLDPGRVIREEVLARRKEPEIMDHLCPAIAKRRVWIATLLLVALAPDLAAQRRHIRFDRIQVEQGLPQATVTCILQDGLGFLWFGTQDGLARFDGRRFVTYGHDPADPLTLSNDHILALAGDPSGDLWVGTRGGGVNRWRRASDSFVHYRHDPQDPTSLASDEVRVLYRDGSGALWMGTGESGLDRFAAVRGAGGATGAAAFEHFRHRADDVTSLSDDRVRTVYEDRLGVLWVGTLEGLNLFDRRSATFLRLEHHPGLPVSLGHNGVRSILEDRAGTLWIGTLGGLNRLDRPTLTFEHFVHDPDDPTSLGGGTVRALYEDRDGRRGVGTDGGRGRVHRRAATFQPYRHHPADATSLSNDRVMSITQDRGGVLWVGTQGGGVNKWNPSAWAFSHTRIDSGGRSNDILAFSEDRDGGLWIGTSGGGLLRLDRTTADQGTVAVDRWMHDPRDPESLPDDRVTTLLHDLHGTLWVGTLASGLARLDRDRIGSRRFRRYVHRPDRDSSLGSDVVMSLYEDRQGVLWIGTSGGGLNRFAGDGDGDGTFVRWRHDPADPSTLSHDRVSALAEDADGRLWVGTFGGGLNRFDRSADPAAGRPAPGTFLRLQRDPARATGLASDTVLVLHVDGGGELWVGTDVGLHRLRSIAADGEAVFERYLERDGLPNDTIYGIRSDQRGLLWLSTNKGLSELDPRSETFRNYGTSHGLQAAEFNMGAHFANLRGELFFGGVNGWNAFDPRRIERNASRPTVVLIAFSRLNQPVTLDRPLYTVEGVELDHRDSVFSFEFAALDYTAPRDNRYRYRLEGWDDDWIDLGSHPRVTFSNLDPGSYRLRVQAANNDGVWNDEELSLRIEIPPPFWQRWWFRLSALGLLGLLAVYLRLRLVRAADRRVEALVGEQVRTLEETRVELARYQQLAARGELAGEVVHQLRGPLATIKNTAYLLRLKKLDHAQVRERSQAIEKEIARADRILGELVDDEEGRG